MAFITKLSRDPLGEFTINFSLRSEMFEITKYPDGVGDRVKGIGAKLKTWNDVNKELDRIRDEFLHEEKLVRTVIIIQIQTSESNFLVSKRKFSIKSTDEKEKVITEDQMIDCSGFQIKWYVAEEYQYARDLKYKVIDAHKNCAIDRYGRINILEQLFHTYHGEVRVFLYREDLHKFLKELDGKITIMLQQLISYFDIDNDKFLKNFETSKIKLISTI